ncbi:hypothetical protein GOODEAATRI_018013, partial [Goodea atripinnis]
SKKCFDLVLSSSSIVLFLKELAIQSLSAEIESLEKHQNLGPSQRLEELQEENARLKYRLNVMKRSLQEETTHCSKSMLNIIQRLQDVFGEAIRTSFPELDNPPLAVTPNQQAKFGDYQCNSAMAMAQVCLCLFPSYPFNNLSSKHLLHQITTRVEDMALSSCCPCFTVNCRTSQSLEPHHFKSKPSLTVLWQMLKAKGTRVNPRDIAEKIVQNLPDNELIQRTEIAGPGRSTTRELELAVTEFNAFRQATSDTLWI